MFFNIDYFFEVCDELGITVIRIKQFFFIKKRICVCHPGPSSLIELVVHPMPPLPLLLLLPLLRFKPQIKAAKEISGGKRPHAVDEPGSCQSQRLNARPDHELCSMTT